MVQWQAHNLRQEPVGKVDWLLVAVWVGAIAYCTMFWYGVARAIDMAK